MSRCEKPPAGQRLGQLLYDGYKRDAWRVLGYGSWTQCVRELAERSGFSKVHGFRLLENERLNVDVLTSGDSLHNSVPNGTEFQTRPLSKLKTDNEKREVWQAAVETAPNGNVTAKHVENIMSHCESHSKLYVSRAGASTLPKKYQISNPLLCSLHNSYRKLIDQTC
jgi:hypothetical protein